MFDREVAVRFDEVVVEVEGEEARIPLHPRLTVLGGLGPAERADLVEHFVAALTGGPARVRLRATDGTGEPLLIAAGPDGPDCTRPDGSPAPAPLGPDGRSAEDLRRLMVLGAPRRAERSREDEPPELREARDTLEELEAELRAAVAANAEVEAGQARLAELDEEIRRAREDAARRAHAAMLAELDALEAELTALRSDRATVDADLRVLAAAEELSERRARWEAAAAAVTALEADAVAATDADPELDVDLPSEPPGDLEQRLAEVVAARAALAESDRRLQELAAARLPEPSYPDIPQLARHDPATLGRAHRRVEAAQAAARQAQLAVGGLDIAGGLEPALLERIEAAHAAVTEAERNVERGRVVGLAGATGGLGLTVIGAVALPVLALLGVALAVVAALGWLVRPRADLRRLAAAEQAVLDEIEAPSYLSFHMRRVEATVDPLVRHSALAAAAELAAAQEEWRALVGNGIPATQAAALESEVAAYREALRALGDTAEEIEHLQRQRTSELEPALREAAAALAEVLSPFRLQLPGPADELDPPLVRAAVDDAVRRGRAARAVASHRRATEAAERSAEALCELLAAVVGSGSLPEDLDRFERLLAQAQDREEARRRARDPEVVAAEIAALRARLEADARPEWAGVRPEVYTGPDPDQLEVQRQALASELKVAAQDLVDVGRLSDRHAAAKRRVAALETKLEGPGFAGSARAIQAHMADALEAAARAGPHQDPVPLVIDDVLSHAPADRRWELLDWMLGLAGHHQLIYLTDDAFVAAWARRATRDELLLLEAAADEPPAG